MFIALPLSLLTPVHMDCCEQVPHDGIWQNMAKTGCGNKVNAFLFFFSVVMLWYLPMSR